MNKLTIGLFIVYLALLFWVLVLKLGYADTSGPSMRTMNLVPYSQPTILNGEVDYGEMILNALIFIPLGIYTGTLFKNWHAVKQVSFFFLVSLFIEGIQFVLAIGAFDITDIINNTIGGITGLLIYHGVKQIFKTSLKTQRFINIFALVATSFILLLLLILKLNHLWVFRMDTIPQQ